MTVGSFTIEFLRVTHSMPDCVAVAIHTPAGVVLHTGDFKIDQTPLDGQHMDFQRFAQLGAEGVLVMLGDSTNVDRKGVSGSERDVIDGFEEVFTSARGRIVVAMFSSSLYRMQILVDLADQFDRKVAFVGRGVIENSQIAHAARATCGFRRASRSATATSATTRRRTSSIICTGSQGEPQAALPRIAIDDHRHAKLDQDDVVVFSAREIPGNEKAIGRVMNHIAKRGADIVHEGIKHIHVSGHGSEEELKLMLSLVRPQLLRADTWGVPPARAPRPDGQDRSPRARRRCWPRTATSSVSMTRGRGSRARSPAGRILIDGTRSGEVGDEVLRDRRHLAGDGLVVPVVAINRQTGMLEETPDVITRGFVLDAQDRGAVEGDPGTRRRRHRGRQRRRADRSRLDEGEDSSGPAAVFPQAFGAPAVRAAGRDGDLTWHPAHLSRRVSEFLGVALFAAALIWLISLASYSAADPVWFFNTGSELPPANFAGRIGAFIGELSYQMLGYAAYLDPAGPGGHRLALLLVPRRWTRRTRSSLGAALLFGCISSFLSLAFGTLDVGGKEFRAGGYIGDRLAAVLAEYLNRTGSIILILTLLFAAIILSTQFSFGRLFSALSQMAPGALGRDARRRSSSAATRRQRDKQRQEVLKKHLGKDGPKESKEPKDCEGARAGSERGGPQAIRRRPSPRLLRAASRRRPRPRPWSAPPPPRLKAASSKPTPPPIKRPAPQMAAKEPTLPLPEPDKAPVERKKGAFTLPPLRAARRAEAGAEDRRAPADGRRAAARGEVPRVLRRRDRRPDPSRARSSRPTSSSRTPA